MADTLSKHYGLAAVGVTGDFNVDIDEAFDDANDVMMDVKTRKWSFRFQLSARAEVARILSFLREQTGRFVFSEIVVGSFQGAPVRLVKDSEFGDRFWLQAFGAAQKVEFTLVADDLAQFTHAVAQAVEDLQN